MRDGTERTSLQLDAPHCRTHHASRITHHATDVLILGAGPAGTATAIALARAGVSVLIADRGGAERGAIGESVPPSARPLLERLGVGEAFLATGARPSYANRSAWGDSRLRDHDFIRDPHGHGWHIDRTRFDVMLVRAAVSVGVRVLHGMLPAGAEAPMASSTVRATHASPFGPIAQDRWATHASPLRDDAIRSRLSQEDRWRIALTGGTGGVVVSARFVVDATGRAAVFARSQGARRRRADRLVGAVGLFGADASVGADHATLVEATPDGWWYSAPLPDGRLVAAFMTDPDLLARSRGGTAEGWWSLLEATEHTRRRVAGTTHRQPPVPRAMAAGSGRLDRIAGDGWLAVGDAAMSFDPLASHGIGAALDGGLRAAAAIRARLDGDIGAPAAYAAHGARSFARYLWMWRAYYAEERRWPDAPFWRRRHAAVETRLPATEGAAP